MAAFLSKTFGGPGILQSSRTGEFIRNSTYGVIEALVVSLLSRIEVHLRISFLASRLNVREQHIIVC